MGILDALFGPSIFGGSQKSKSSSSFWGSNESYNDYGAYSDRSLDDECDCGYCSDHDYDESCHGHEDDSFGW